MTCIKCRAELPKGALYCPACGKKQTAGRAKYHKREHGSGTICKDTRYKKPWVAHAPASKYGGGRQYLGCFATRKEAAAALEEYIKHGRPELYSATLADVYRLWTEKHFPTVSEAAEKLYSSMWKRFSGIAGAPMRELRTAHFQEVVSSATSKSAADTLKAMAVMMCRVACENDITAKNYGEFIVVPKFEKKEKRIFSGSEIAALWASSSGSDPCRIVLFMIYTGLRIGELLKLTAADVHLSEGYLVGGEKTAAGKNRVVPLPPMIPELGEFLHSWCERAGEGRLFPMSPGRFRSDVFPVALATAGIQPDGLTPHSTRHTFASLSSSAGVKPESLQRIIGHASYTTTADVYIHHDLEGLIEEMRKLRK